MSRQTPRILVVDDEPGVLNLIVYNLKKANYETLTGADGRQALELAHRCRPDLILLDLMLPEIDGLEVCRTLRRDSGVPIIMITARGEEIDRVVGLELGADDYVCKPFSMRELMARIKAVMRRSQAEQDNPSTRVYGPAGLWMDVETREAGIGENPLQLTRLEFDLLYKLLANAGRVITREKLLEDVWGYDFSGDTRTVDSAVKRLRAALRAIDAQADRIEAVRGLGYKFNGGKREDLAQDGPGA